jgi:hypothetical protein
MSKPRPFEDWYIPEPTSGCWLWEGYVNKDGYGTVTRQGQIYMAHRYSWIVNRGEIPPGLYLLHRCDTPPCINPDHLYLGTAADNAADMKRRGRQLDQSGEHNHSAKLTEEDVLAIRADARIQREIALDYGINRSLVSLIKARKTWTHIP